MNGYDKIFNEIKEKFIQKTNRLHGDILCKIKYKYDFEDNYTTEVIILKYNFIYDTWSWTSEWWEGQNDCILDWAIYVGDINVVLADDNAYMYEKEPFIDRLKNLLNKED